jgi:hypothetical protein
VAEMHDQRGSPASTHETHPAWLVDRYVQSAVFKGLRESTQRARHNILKVVCETGGKVILSQMDRKIDCRKAWQES